MTETTGRKEQTHRKMVDAAGRQFRRHGYAGIGVAGVAKAAGVTSGAFYDHFGSKDGAFAAAVDAGLDEVIDGIPKFQAEHGAQWVRAFADYYLGCEHRKDSERCCAMATLTPDIVRSDKGLHMEFEKKMTIIADRIADGLAGGSQRDRRMRAWAMLGILTGGLNLARAMGSAGAGREVAEAIRAAAIQAAGKT